MRATRLVIITVPPQPVADEIAALQQRLCSVGGSRAALAWPPHVTLRTGALVPPSELGAFVQGLGRALGDWQSFVIRTDGLWMEDSPRRDLGAFVGLRVKKDAALVDLNRRLLTYTPWRKSDRVSLEPHVTLAFDDLSPPGLRVHSPVAGVAPGGGA